LDLAGENINSGVFLGGGLVLLGLFVVFSRLLFSDGQKKPRIEERETPPVEKISKNAVVEEAAPEVVTHDLESLEETIAPVDEALGFSKIDFKGAGEVFIEMAENDSLNIEGDQKLVDKVKTEVRDGVLLVTFPSGETGWKGLMGIGKESRLRYFITVKALDEISLDGAGSIHSDKLEGENLKIHHAGLGKILFKEFQYQNLDVELTGLGEIEIEGEVQTQAVHISGAGAYKADRLKSQEADVILTGAGTSQVWVEKKLIASLTGAGSIKYKGTPILEESKTGLGNIGPITQ
ncbi:MAG: head GIN domain-containing protein, partial [Chloroflexota bacterium]|nr:head GIN domain-containing protein [Chloroflexota bacterium]